MSATIQSGARVTLHFRLALLKDGREVDSTYGGEPLTITLGQGDLIEGLENHLLGLQAGDARRFEIPCAQAFGQPEPDNIHTLPRDQFPGHISPEPGLVVGFQIPGGEEVPGVIRQVTDQGVEVDFSHPLAGHDLLFEVEILAIT